MANNSQISFPIEMHDLNQDGQIKQAIYPQFIEPVNSHKFDYPRQEVQFSPVEPVQLLAIKIASKTPVILNCQYCQRQIQTIVDYEAGTGAYIVGGILAALGLWFGCCLIPCFMKDCKDSVHFCPTCLALLGKKRFLFD